MQLCERLLVPGLSVGDTGKGVVHSGYVAVHILTQLYPVGKRTLYPHLEMLGQQIVGEKQIKAHIAAQGRLRAGLLGGARCQDRHACLFFLLRAVPEPGYGHPGKALDFVRRIQSGIDELKEKQRSINKELAKADKIAELVEAFIKTKDAMIVERINALFQVAKFSFLSQRLNGKDNITCSCTVNGVDYKDVNNAGRINAGLDVINAFSRAKGINIPIFIDNAESVQEFLPTDSQKILLYVRQGDNMPDGAVLLASDALK